MFDLLLSFFLISKIFARDCQLYGIKDWCAHVPGCTSECEDDDDPCFSITSSTCYPPNCMYFNYSIICASVLRTDRCYLDFQFAPEELCTSPCVKSSFFTSDFSLIKICANETVTTPYLAVLVVIIVVPSVVVIGVVVIIVVYCLKKKSANSHPSTHPHTPNYNPPTSVSPVVQMPKSNNTKSNHPAVEMTNLTNPLFIQQNNVINGFKFEGKLGKGAYGEVWKCKKINNGKIYAIKIVSALDKFEIMFAEGIRLTCPFLISYFQSFKDPSFPDKVFLVIEYCSHGDLRSALNILHENGAILKPERVMKILIQGLMGLYDLHQNKILHRDLKPDNILVDNDYNIKISDFGCGKLLEATEEKADTFAGTPFYIAPELFKGEEYGAKADIWSLGVIGYELCTQELPFKGNQYTISMIIPKGEYVPIPQGTYPDDIRSLIHSMLTVDPAARPSAENLLRLPVVETYGKELGLGKYLLPK